MTDAPESVRKISSSERDAVALGNAAVQILSEFGRVEKVGRYWVARLDVEDFVLASVIGPPKPNSMPETVNVKVSSGTEIVLDLEWGEDHCDVMTFSPGDWQIRLSSLGAAMQRRSAAPDQA